MYIGIWESQNEYIKTKTTSTTNGGHIGHHLGPRPIKLKKKNLLNLEISLYIILLISFAIGMCANSRQCYVDMFI